MQIKILKGVGRERERGGGGGGCGVNISHKPGIPYVPHPVQKIISIILLQHNNI